MSYILDALRRSEHERRQAEPEMAALDAPRAVAPPRRDIGAPLTALAVGAAVAVLAGAWWLFNANLQPPPLRTAAATAPVEDRPAREAALSSEPSDAASSPTQPPGAAPAAERLAKARPAPKLQPSPFAVPPARGSERDLAEEARIDRAPVRPTAAAPAAPRAPATPQPATPPAEAPVKFLRAMPDEFRRALPPLEVTIHIYAPRAADRILYINNRQYQAGDEVGQGVRLERIIEDGAVLSYRGQRFKLPRPS